MLSNYSSFFSFFYYVCSPAPPHVPTENLHIDLIPKEYNIIGTSTNTLHQFGVGHSEEDGLNSNIFVPLSALQKGAASIPALVFIYGGSYRTGSNAFPLYGMYPFHYANVFALLLFLEMYLKDGTNKIDRPI